MRDVLDKISDYVIVIDLEGIIKYCNTSVLRDLGYKPSEVNHKSIENIIGLGVSTEKFIEQVIEGQIDKIILDLKPIENRIAEADVSIGKWEGEKVIFLTMNQIGNCICTWSEMMSFMEVFPFYICMSSIKNEYVYSNQSYREWIKVEEDEFTGATWWDIFDKEVSHEIEIENTEVITTKRATYKQSSFDLKERGTQWYEKYKIPVIDAAKQVKYIVTLGKNITLQKKLYDRIDKSYLEIEKIYNSEDHMDYSSSPPMLLEGVQEEVMKELGADGVKFWIYNSKEQELVSSLKAGICQEMVHQIEKIPMNEQQIAMIMEDHSFEGIRARKDVVEEHIPLIGIQEEVEYVGLYRIRLNTEFLGTVVLLYKQMPGKSSIDETFIRQNCNQIGILLKNERLAIELRRQLEKRREIEEELQQYLDTAASIMVILDKNGNYIKVNNAMVDLLGWSKEELLQMNSNQLTHPQDRGHNLTYKIGLMLDLETRRRIVNRYLHKNGKYLWLDWGIKYLEDKEVYVCTAKDVTKEKVMQKQQDEYEKRLHTETVKNEFFSNMSHEFRTPLNIIISAMQLMNTTIEEEEEPISKQYLKKHTNYIRQNAYRLLKLVNNVMDITKIDTGYYQLNLGNYNIIEIVEEITLSVAQYIQGKGVELVFDTEIEEQIMACDPEKIERIILNLLSNAIKYTKSQGEISVNIGIENENIIISVKDNGIGVPKEKLESIFERFIQVDNSLTRKSEGSGIGLSLVKALVEMHQGNIWARSDLGEGTEFILKFPITKVGAPENIETTKGKEMARIDKCYVEFSDIYSLQ